MNMTLRSLEVALEELTSEELLELEQECVAEEETREKRNLQQKKNPPSKITVKNLAGAFANLNKFFRIFENMSSNTKGFH